MARFYWLGIPGDVRQWCASCLECQFVNQLAITESALRPLPLMAIPFECIGMDLTGPFHQKCYCVVVVLVEYVSQYPNTVATAFCRCLSHSPDRRTPEQLGSLFFFYWQISSSPESKEKAALSTLYCLYQFVTLSLSLSSTSWTRCYKQKTSGKRHVHLFVCFSVGHLTDPSLQSYYCISCIHIEYVTGWPPWTKKKKHLGWLNSCSSSWIMP